MMLLRDRTKGTVAVLRALAIVSAICLASAAMSAAEEKEAEFDLHEFSLWGFDPTLENANQLQHFPTVLPGVVDVSRSRADAEGKITPFSLMTFHGQAVKSLEIDLRVQSGRFVAHWPAGESKSGRLRWLDLIASPEHDPDGRIAPVDSRHWFNEARQLDSLFLRLGARSERFIIYDAELKLSQPLQISGGPDRYQLTNLGKTPLYDVLVIAPEGDKRRIGRLAELPAAKPAAATQPAGPAKPAEAKPAEAKPATEGKAAEAKPAEAKPAEAATVKVEAVKVAAAPGAPQTAATPQPADPKTAAPGAAPAPAVPAGEPVEIEMSAPLALDAEELTSAKQSLADSLRKQGFTDKEVSLIIDRTAPALFGAKELLVVCRLPPDAIEERLPLVTYPAARKTIRAAWVCSRNVDPKIKDEVKQLVAQLAATDYAQRESAEKRLAELGRLAIPALKEALKSPDPEVQFRAERLLLAQNEKIEG